MVKIGVKIHELRTKQRMRINKLADIVGVSAPYISQIESGTRRAKVDLLQKIATALGVQPSYFLDDETAQPMLGSPADMIMVPVYDFTVRAGAQSGPAAEGAETAPTKIAARVDAADGCCATARGSVAPPPAAAGCRDARPTPPA